MSELIFLDFIYADNIYLNIHKFNIKFK
jgi:hypothetical protein